MDQVTKKRIIDLWMLRPDGTKCPPASSNELADFEATHKDIPEDYRWFLFECGSGVVGSEWLDGIDDLYASHQKFNEECSIENGWRHKSQFVIGWDGSGSPIGVTPNGQIGVEHPGEEELVILSNSIEEFLLSGLSV